MTKKGDVPEKRLATASELELLGLQAVANKGPKVSGEFGQPTEVLPYEIEYCSANESVAYGPTDLRAGQWTRGQSFKVPKELSQDVATALETAGVFCRKEA